MAIRHAEFFVGALLLAGACTGERGATDPVATWRIERDVVVGGADEGPGSFSDVRDIAVDSRGRLYVLEAQEQEVRLFGADGTFLGSIGRNGDGPGEFRGANGIDVDVSDRLWVYDPRARRVTVFDSGGAVAATHQMVITSRGFVWAGGVDSLGRVYDEQVVPQDTGSVMVIRRTDPTTGAADTVPWPTCGAQLAPTYAFRSERSSGVMRVPYSTGLYRRLDPRGFAWCADTREVRAQQYRLGDSLPLRTIAAPAVPAPVTAEERDSAVAQVRVFGGRIGEGNVDLGLIPGTKPVLQAIDVDDAGRTWVRAVTSLGTELFVFDSLGRHVARAAFPGELKEWHPLVVRGDRIHVVMADSLDVPVVARFRVVR